MEGSVIFTANQVTAEPHKPMRVRHAKRGTKTPLSSLAKAEAKYAFGKVEKETSRNVFNKTVAPMRKITTLKSVGIFTEDSRSSVNNLLRNVLLFKKISFERVERELKLFNTDVRIPTLEKLREQLGKAQEEKEHLRAKGIGFGFTKDIRDAIEEKQKEIVFLRNRIGFFEHTKPYVTYAVNTDIRITVGRYSKGEDIILPLKIGHVTIRKTFRNIVNVMGKEEEQCCIYFDRSVCKKVQVWFDSITLTKELNNIQ